MLVRGGIAPSDMLIAPTVNRLSTNGLCSRTFIPGRIGPWGIGYTFPRHPECPVLRIMQSNGRMYLSISQLYLSLAPDIPQFSSRLALD